MTYLQYLNFQVNEPSRAAFFSNRTLNRNRIETKRLNKRTLANMLLVVTHKHDQIFVQMAKKKNEGRCEEKLKLGKKKKEKLSSRWCCPVGPNIFTAHKGTMTERESERKQSIYSFN